MAASVASSAAFAQDLFPSSQRQGDLQQQQQQQQVLVRFQNTTHVVHYSTGSNNDTLTDKLDWLLQLWSDRTGWPVSCLRIARSSLASLQQQHHQSCSSAAVWWLDIEVQSSICGGKGGFGTLLKGQSRQAGAKLTTDFGACRDLQGRRLRHVNDEIKLRKWREAQEKKKLKQQRGGGGGGDDGSDDEADDDYLWKTPSGLYNWHLLTPAWADLSKKTISRTQRHFKTHERQQKREKQSKAQQEKQLLEDSLQHYVQKSALAVESFQASIGSAILQGLQAKETAAQTKKRKRLEEMVQKQRQHEVLDINQQPSSLVTLSGEVIVVDPETQESPLSSSLDATVPPPRLQIQFKSDFATAVLVLDQTLPNATAGSDEKDKKTSARLYYEIQLVTGGLAQIGWASLVPADAPTEPNGSEGREASLSKISSVVFAPNNDLGDGVGDDGASFAFDGSRGKKFHAGKEESYGTTSSWKAGDVVGCLYDSSSGTISYFLNGRDLGVAFTVQQQPPLILFPAVSCNEGETVTWHVRQEECLHFPVSATAVHDLIVIIPKATTTVTTSTDDDAIKEKIPILPNTSVDKAVTTDVTPNAVTVAVEDTPKPAAVIILPEPLDLEPFSSAEALEELGMGRLMSALMAEQCKCGGTLSERAARLFSLKGLKRSEYPKKVQAKGFAP